MVHPAIHVYMNVGWNHFYVSRLDKLPIGRNPASWKSQCFVLVGIPDHDGRFHPGEIHFWILLGFVGGRFWPTQIFHFPMPCCWQEPTQEIGRKLSCSLSFVRAPAVQRAVLNPDRKSKATGPLVAGRGVVLISHDL